MPTPLPSPVLSEPGPVLQAWRMGEQDQLARQQRGVLQQAGQMAAGGQLAGAQKHLLAQGMFDEAKGIEGMMQRASDQQLAKAQRTYKVLGGLAMAADTPEKWQMALQAAGKAGMDVSKYGDFGARDLVLAQSGMIGDSLDNQLKQRALARQSQLDQENRDQTQYERTRQGNLDARQAEQFGLEFNLRKDIAARKENPPQFEFNKEGIGNKYTGEFRRYEGSGVADPGELSKDYRWRMKDGKKELDASGRPIAEPIPGGKGESVTPEVSARLGLADKFAKDAPLIEKEIKGGVLDTSFTDIDFQLGRGKAGQVYRRIEDGSEALVRNLTGAGMNETEARSYAERFLPGRLDTQTTKLEKLRNLSKNLKAVQNRVMTGRGIASIDDLNAALTEKPSQDSLVKEQAARGTPDDPLGILGN